MTTGPIDPCVALTRGTGTNLAYVFTASPARAGPMPGRRPAPELAPRDQIYTERSGDPAPATPRPPRRARRPARDISSSGRSMP
jgi:hypothetical protein